MKLASVNMKKVASEIGGKTPLIMFEDADLDSAVRWSCIDIMTNQGQTCPATSRVLKFVEFFKKKIQKVS